MISFVNFFSYDKFYKFSCMNKSANCFTIIRIFDFYTDAADCG